MGARRAPLRGRSVPRYGRTAVHPVLTAKAATRRGARLCALCPPKAPLSIVPHAVRQHIDNSPDLGYYVGCWQAGVSSSARSAVCSPSGTLIDQGTCNKGWRKGGVRVSDFRDRTIRCEDCRNTFVFTAGEQAFYQERGFSEPKRCPSCRAARKASRPGSAHAASRPSGGRRDRPARQMFSIVCDDCGQTAQVPFKPSGDRPVYCRDCYERHR